MNRSWWSRGLLRDPTPPGSPPGGAAGGDLAGTYPTPSVDQIHGVAYNGDPLVQYVLRTGRAGTANDVTLSTGTTGTLTGADDEGGTLVLQSTSDTGKGLIAFGAAQQSGYDEAFDRLGIGDTASQYDVDVQKTTVGFGFPVSIRARNLGEDATSDACMTVEVNSPIAGDPYLHWKVGAGGSEWTLGIDNSDSDSLKLAPSNAIDASTVLRISTAGDLETTGKLTTYNALAVVGFGVAAILDAPSLTAQVADVTDTAFANSGVTGLYRISVYLVTTTADLTAGAVTCNVKFDDGTGSRTISTGPVLLTTLGAMAQATIVAQRGAGTITYGVTHTGAFGTADYALYATCERLT